MGGSALHYGAQAFLPLDVDYLHWQNETGVDWTQENFKDAVEEVRTMFNIHPAPRELLDVGQQLYERAATQLGHDLERMSHARKNCIYCGIGCRDGQMSKYDSKMNSFVAHLPIAEKYGVEIIPNTHVQKVMIEKKGSDFVTTGIWAEQGNRAVQFLADRVLLCACEGGTPWILYNSGYGPRDLWARIWLWKTRMWEGTWMENSGLEDFRPIFRFLLKMAAGNARSLLLLSGWFCRWL